MDKLSPELLRELLSAVGDYLAAADESASIVVGEVLRHVQRDLGRDG